MKRLINTIKTIIKPIPKTKVDDQNLKASIYDRVFYSPEGVELRFITTKKIKVKEGLIISNHYCKVEYGSLLIDYCVENGLKYENHGVKTNDNGKNWCYISLHNGKNYLSGQAFHRVYKDMLLQNNIKTIPINEFRKLNKNNF